MRTCFFDCWVLGMVRYEKEGEPKPPIRIPPTVPPGPKPLPLPR